MLRFVPLLCVFVFSTSALADSAGCWSIRDDATRLACYDKTTKNTVPPTNAAPQEPVKVDSKASETDTDSDDATVSTKEVVATPPLAPPQNVDAEDLAIAPNKFIDKNIAIKDLQCFYADKNEYRCISSHHGIILMIVVGDVTPQSEKDRLENDCGKIKNLTSASCRRALRFVPMKVKNDSVDLRDRTVVMSLTAEVIPAVSQARSRRRY